MAERIAIAPEVSYGVNPGAGFVYYPFRREDMGATFATVSSELVQPDLNPRDAVRVGAEQGGGFEFEVMLGVLNPLLEGVFRNSFTADLNISGNISAAEADNSFNGTGLFTNVKVGQWVLPSGLSAALDVPHYVTSKPSNDKIIVATDIPGDVTGDGDETMRGSMLRPGDTLVSYAIERQHTDESHFFLALGQVPQTFSLRMALRQLLSGNLGFYGRPESRFASTQTGGGATAAAQNEILGPIDHIKAVRIGDMGADASVGLSSVNIDWNNNYQGEEELGKFGIQRVQKRTPDVTGQISAYLASSGIGAILDAVGSATRQKLSFRLEDGAGNMMVVTLHKAYLRQHRSNVQGNQQSKFANIDMTVETDRTDPANPLSIQLDWFPAS